MFSIRHFTLASLASIALTVFIPGCGPERPDVIPSSAQIGSSGNGMLHFIAPSHGMVYIYDTAQTRLVWSGDIRRGESVDVDPQKNRIMVADTVRANKLLVGNDHIDIYFDSTPILESPPQPSNNSVTVTPNVTVEPSNGQSPSNGVTVQPGVTVTPTPAPQRNP